MRRFPSLLAALIGICLLLAAPASAATTLGGTDALGQTVTQRTGPELDFMSGSGAGEPAYSSPITGVITSWSMALPAGADGSRIVELAVLRPSTGNAFAVVSTVSALPNGPAGTVQTFTVSPGLALRQGDTVGLYVPSGLAVSTVPGRTNDTVGYYTNGLSYCQGSQPVGGCPLPSPDGTVAGRALFSATVEPDVDGDGYGDESQDSCPSDPTIHTGACKADVSLAQSFTASPIVAGGDGVLLATVRNTAASTPASDVALTELIPTGVSLVGAAASGGACTGDTILTCPIGTLPPGATGYAEVVVRTPDPGRFRIDGSLASGFDPNPANDRAAAVLTVTAAPPAPAAPAPKATVLCRVPRVTGLTAAAAKARLVKAGCRLGRISRVAVRRRLRRHGSPTITAQAVPAGVQVLAGTAVAVTLSR